VAIYHFSMKALGRSAGRSSTAAAAYRAGCEITDERTGEIHDYRRKSGVDSADIVLPNGCAELSRSDLWNGVEKHHKRGDSLVAREFEVALPDELPPEERRRLAVDFAREVANHYSIAADVCVHQPSKDGDERNYHAHILLSACTITKSGYGKKAAELDPIHCRRHQIPNPAEHWRERWAELANERLRENGIEASVDHRSLEAQGIDRVPSSHLGPAVSGMVRRGAPSKVQERLEAEAATQREFQERLDLEIAAQRDLLKMIATLERQRNTWAQVVTNLEAADLTATPVFVRGTAPVAIPPLLTPVREEPRRRDPAAINPLSRYHPDNITRRALEAQEMALAIKIETERANKEMVDAMERHAKRPHRPVEAILDAAPTTPWTKPLRPLERPVEAILDAAPTRSWEKPKRSLVELLKASLDTLKKWIKAKGMNYEDANAEQGEYIGAIIKADELHAVQDKGRGSCVIHEQANLSHALKVDESNKEIHIKYRNGHGMVRGVVEVDTPDTPTRPRGPGR
jgi:hypothetical protein